jgi:hypothetical protein
MAGWQQRQTLDDGRELCGDVALPSWGRESMCERASLCPAAVMYAGVSSCAAEMSHSDAVAENLLSYMVGCLKPARAWQTQTLD